MAIGKLEPIDPLQAPAVRNYTLISLLALVVVLLVLLEKGCGEWSLAPVALGCVSLLLHVRFGPPLVMLALVWLLLANSWRADPIRVIVSATRNRVTQGIDSSGQDLSEVALAGAVLIFTLGFYRTQSLVYHLFPIDSRLRRRRLPNAGHLEKRSLESVESLELPLLVGAGFIWSFLAWIFWQWLIVQRPRLGFEVPFWRGLVLFWLVSMGLVLTLAVLAYLAQAGAGPEANAIYLQDQLWQQTRREQSRINRWLTWARLRGQRRKEAQ
jgi:hypothetical protein